MPTRHSTVGASPVGAEGFDGCVHSVRSVGVICGSVSRLVALGGYRPGWARIATGTTKLATCAGVVLRPMTNVPASAPDGRLHVGGGGGAGWSRGASAGWVPRHPLNYARKRLRPRRQVLLQVGQVSVHGPVNRNRTSMAHQASPALWSSHAQSEALQFAAALPASVRPRLDRRTPVSGGHFRVALGRGNYEKRFPGRPQPSARGWRPRGSEGPRGCAAR